MTNDEMLKMACELVRDYTNERAEDDGVEPITIDDVFIVWFCKTLQNWKAMVSTNRTDHMFYEVSYNGDRHEVYLDAYRKQENRRLSVNRSSAGTVEATLLSRRVIQ